MPDSAAFRPKKNTPPTRDVAELLIAFDEARAAWSESPWTQGEIEGVVYAADELAAKIRTLNDIALMELTVKKMRQEGQP